MFGSCILYSSRDWTAPCFENWLFVKFSLNSLCMELLEVCQPLTVHSGQRPSMRDGMESPKVKRNPQNYFFSPLQQLFGAHFNCSLLNLSNDCESHCTGFWGSPTRPDGFNATPKTYQCNDCQSESWDLQQLLTSEACQWLPESKCWNLQQDRTRRLTSCSTSGIPFYSNTLCSSLSYLLFQGASTL